MTSLAVLCVSALVAQAAPPPATRSVAVWVVVDKQVPPRINKQATREINKLAPSAPGWTLVAPTAAQKRKLAALGRKCFPAANIDCAVRAAALVDAPYVLVAHLARSRPAPGLILELVDVQARAVLARADGTVHLRSVADDVGAVWKTLLTNLAPPAVATLTPPPVTPAAPPEPAAPPPEAPPVAVAAPAELPPSQPAPSPEAPVTPAIVTVAAGEPQEEWQLDSEDPVVLHAEASALRLDGKLDEARQLLRRAIQLAPNDTLVAFDLAKLALSGVDEAFDSDVAPFLQQTPSTADAHLLRAHILLRRGGKDEAAEQLRAALSAQADNVEALRLQLVLAPEAPATPTRSWSARIGTGAQADSNVAVLPDDTPAADRLQGIRAVIDGSTTAKLVRGPLAVDTSLRFNLASQINDRANPIVGVLADIGTIGLSVRGRAKTPTATVTTELTGSQVLLNSFADSFMRDGGLRFEVRAPLRVEVGGYAGGAWRDFGLGNTDGQADDRDGAKVEGGLLVAGKKGGLHGQARVGVQAELAQGRDQREWGPHGDVSLGVAVAEMSIDAAFAYDLRDYYNATSERRDHRLTPSLRLAYTFTDNLGAYASYVLMKSVAGDDYGFTRHLGAAGVFASW